MHYSDQVLHPNFDSYCLTWYDSSFSNDGPYGEPIQYVQEGFDLFYDEPGDSFLSGYWFSENRKTDQVYDCNGDSNWVDEYASYFASYWGEDMVPCGYGYDDGEDEHYYVTEKVEGTTEVGHQEEGAYSVKPWLGYHFDFLDRVDDYYIVPGKLNQPPANNKEEDPWSYMGLWESIFGRPCFQRLDEERPPE